MEGAFGVLAPVPSIQTCALPAPPVGPENPGQWYHDALQLPLTRVRGWFGCTLGSEEDNGDVQLLFYSDDHLEPVLRLVMRDTELMAVFAGIGNLLHTRLGLLKEWNLKPADAP